MATIAWKNAVSGDWSDAADWSTDTVPTAADDVGFALVGNYIATVATAETANTLGFNAPRAQLIESAAGMLALGSLVVQNGYVELDAANSVGSSFIYGGEVAVGRAGALGEGELTIAGGELLGTATETLTNQLDLSGQDDAAASLTIAAAHGATLTLDGSAGWTFGASTTLEFGAPTLDGVVVWRTPAGSGGAPVAINVRAGTLQAGDGSFSNLFAAATTTVSSGAAIDLAGFSTAIATLQGGGNIIDSGAAATLTLAGGAFGGVISGGISLDLTGSAAFNGLSQFTGGTTVEPYAELANAGVFDLTTDAGVAANGSDAAVFNYNLFEKTGGTGTSTISTPFSNFGEVVVTSGSITFTGGFTNGGVVEGLLSQGPSGTTVTANAAGQTTFFGGFRDNLITATSAPTYVDGGGGFDTLEIAASMTLAAGSLVNVEMVQVDNGVTANLAHLAGPENITLASKAGGGATVTGGHGADTITGGAGNDVINGGLGVDSMTGGAGDDVYYVNNAGDKVFEAVGGGADTVTTSVSYALAAGQEIETLRTLGGATGATAINLTGNGFNNTLIGNAGANVLDGGAGNDTLWGHGGADKFLFDTALNASTNVDRLADFAPGTDKIELSHAIFSALAPGALPANDFVIGAAAQNASEHIIYNSSTGALYYDPNGKGGAAATQFAALSAGLALTSADFIVV